MFWFRHRLPAVPAAAVLLALALFQIPAVRGQVVNRTLETRLTVAEMNVSNANRRADELEKKAEQHDKELSGIRVELAEIRLKLEWLIWLNGGVGIFIVGNAANYIWDTMKRRLLMAESKRDTKS